MNILNIVNVTRVPVVIYVLPVRHLGSRSRDHVTVTCSVFLPVFIGQSLCARRGHVSCTTRSRDENRLIRPFILQLCLRMESASASDGGGRVWFFLLFLFCARNRNKTMLKEVRGGDFHAFFAFLVFWFCFSSNLIRFIM